MNRLEFLKNIKFPKMKRPSVGQIIFWVVVLALSVGTFVFARNITACWEVTPLAGRIPDTCGGGASPLAGPDLNPQGTPNAVVDAAPPTPVAEAPAVPLPAAWDGASRINILFIGLDFRDWQANAGPPRSDTMILFTVDPITKTAGMLSLPRDLWVNIPGYQYGRINMAYFFGEGDKLPGGGPGLAMKTVEQFLGVKVHYYAQVDFNTFTSLVDKLGCITIIPEETLTLDPVGPGTDHVKITAGGERELCGWKVLAYARTRHSQGGDMDRARRQQQVIFALQEKIFDPQVFPSLILQAPEMYAELQNGIHTNMPLEDAIKLAVLGKDIARSSIKTGVIGTDMVAFENTVLGGEAASVMKPITDKVRVLRDEIFTTSGPLSPMAQGEPAVLMRTEEARVRIVDGTFTAGLDQRAGTFFQSQGMNVTEVGPAPEVYASTFIIVYGPKLYTIRYLQSVFGIPSSNIRFSPDPASTVDIEIRLGSDIAGSIP